MNQKASIYFLWILFITLMPMSLSGQNDKKNSNIKNIADSMRVVDSVYRTKMPDSYLSLKKHSQKNGIGKQLYRLLIKEPRIRVNTTPQTSHVYDPYAGKVIRKINVNVIAPFRSRDAGITNFLNDSHVKTKQATVLSMIQFKKYSRVNPALIVTSEADLRNARFISSASISIDSIANCTDSVDVNIDVRDKWTIGLHLNNLSSSRVAFEVYDANILGSGSRAAVGFRYSEKYLKNYDANKKYGFSLSYLYRNILKQNIQAEGYYKDRIESTDGLLKIGRPIQPRYRYFGEAQFKNYSTRPELIDWDSISPNKTNEISFAIGRTFNYRSQNYINQFVLTARLKSQHSSYDYLPYKEYMEDRLRSQKYSNYTIFLLQASLFRNSYKQEYMIYNVGTTEDVAIGYNLTAQLGYSKSKSFNDAFYASFGISAGASSIQAGAIYLKGQIGSFFNADKVFGGVLKLESRYFTPVKELMGLYFRQFVTIKYTQLFDSEKYFDDYVYIGQYTNLKLRHWERDRKGKHSLLIQAESNVFSTIQLAGFRFAFYGFVDFGWLGQNFKLITSDNFNYGYGLGVRMRNNFIVFNTINIKIGFYPKNDSG